MTEEWKLIPGYNNRYEASTYGRIRSLPSMRIMVPFVNERGYLRATLSINGKVYSRQWHRLIAITFVENPDDKPAVNHKNGIKSDNSPSNLEWCTCLENNRHARKMGLTKPSENQRAFIRNLGLSQTGKNSPGARLIIDISTGIFFDTIKEASFCMQISIGRLNSYLRGKCKNKTNLRYA